MSMVYMSDDYLHFVCNTTKKYMSGEKVPEILYYEVLYIYKYLKTKDVLHEMQCTFEGWLDCVDVSDLTDSKVRGLKEHELMLIETQERGVWWYLKQSKGRVFLLGVLGFILVLPLYMGGMAFIESQVAMIKMLAVVGFAGLGACFAIDFAYLAFPSVRLVDGDSKGIFSENARLSVCLCEKQINAETVTERYKALIQQGKKPVEGLLNKRKTAEFYDIISDMELNHNLEKVGV